MTKPIQKILFSLAASSRALGKRLSAKDRAWHQLLQDWKRLDREKHFRTSYDLTKQAVVFDLGGYKGQWASDIYSQYLCTIHLFEPHPRFCANIEKRFQLNKNIKVYNFGLASTTRQAHLTDQEESSSTLSNTTKNIAIQLKEAHSFLTEKDITSIDLMKINIEGGEYDLLTHLIEKNWITKIKDLQIQFHHFVPQAEHKMKVIQAILEKTHYPTYQYPFFWENWRLKK